MRTNRLAVGVLCVGLLGAGVAQAQVWKCKSLKTGQIEYSDIQCDGKSTVASTISARPNQLDSSGSREQAALLQQREQNEAFQRQVDSLRRQAADAIRRSSDSGNDACASAQSAYERAKSSRAAPSIMLGLKNRVSAACGRAPASASRAYAAPVTPQVAPPPASITHCDSAGCWDSNGTRYDSGGGGTYYGSNGKTCQAEGDMMECH